MPTRGYRKGSTDNKEPVPCSVRTHISRAEFKQMKEQAGDRSLTMSKLLRQVVQANIKGTRLKAPHRSGASHQVIRQFTRVGNNLNQIARQVNTGKVQVRKAEIDAVITQLRDVLGRF